MTAGDRSARTAAADTLCAAAFAGAGAPDAGVALVAVGGYGRGELAPYSDLDLVLVHDDGVVVGEWAEQLWYPLWDSGTRVDHAVRTFSGTVSVAGADLRVALGLLDLRHVTGDPNLTVRLRTTLLAQWRRAARRRLPALQELVRTRHERAGELAQLSVPDLKEAAGGLRDAGVLRALVATWLVDLPHVEAERCRQSLLDVRDLLHEASGRAIERIGPEAWGDLATGLGLAEEEDAQRHVRELGRRLAHLSRLTWRRVDGVLAAPARAGRVRAPDLNRVAPGLALSSGEVVLERAADPAADPLLLLRAAAEAAERGAALGPATATRLAGEARRLGEPWPAAARQLLVRLLASGPGLLGVWETLDQTGALRRILPEWERIRLLPHASPIHRFTVDRHVVETCIEAAALIRRVSRPDVLVAAAVLHDIGKGGLTDHSTAGAPLARTIATRWGFDPPAVATIGRLVRWHLLLVETATTRDPEDPATVAMVSERLADRETTELLLALTEADARATTAKAWSSWRAGLVGGLGTRVCAVTAGGPLPDPRPPVLARPDLVGGLGLAVDRGPDGCRVTVVARDRVGLLADVAAVLALQPAEVRAVRAWSEREHGVSVWEVADALPEEAVLRQRFDAVVAGRTPGPPDGSTHGPEPVVVVRPEASREATVLEVRAGNRSGVLHRALAALAHLELSVRSAHVDTLGPQAVDVFYLQEVGAGRLTDTRAAAAAHAVRRALAVEAGVRGPAG